MRSQKNHQKSLKPSCDNNQIRLNRAAMILHGVNKLESVGVETHFNLKKLVVFLFFFYRFYSKLAYRRVHRTETISETVLFYILKIFAYTHTSIDSYYCRRTRVGDPVVNIISVENPTETRWRVDYPAGTLFRLASSPTFSAKRVVRTEVRHRRRRRQCCPGKTNQNRTNILRRRYDICLQQRVWTKTTITFCFLFQLDSILRRPNTIHRPREQNSNRKPKKHCFRSTDRFNRLRFLFSPNNGRFYLDFVSHRLK